MKLASTYWRKNRDDVSVFEFCVEALHVVDVCAVYEKRQELLRFSFLVVDVFSEVFAISLGKQGDKFVYGDAVLHL